jgi:small-conductance mechanosensitive channel
MEKKTAPIINSITLWVIFFLVVGVLIGLAGCGAQPVATPVGVSPSPSPPPTITITPAATPPALTPEAYEENDSGLPGLNLGPLQNLPTRTPQPTAGPDVVADYVSEILQEMGLAERELLTVEYADWINLAISVLSIVAGYLVGTWFIRRFLPRLARRTKTPLDDRLLKISGNEVRWLVVLFTLRFAIQRLVFIRAEVKMALTDIIFFVTLFIVVRTSFRLIALTREEAEHRATVAGRRQQSDPFITLSTWAFQLVVVIVALYLILARLGANITGLAILLGLISFAFSLAGRDMLADVLFGAIILTDRPYRAGDRIDLPNLNTWGDVYEIGMRTTKVRLIDNRMVIIPNSQMGNNQIINYSYVGPALFDFCEVMVGHDNDIEAVEQLLIDTIRNVDGVLVDRPIGVWLMEFREYSAVFTTAWWIGSYAEKYNVRNRVNRAIAKALREAGVVMPSPIRGLGIDFHALEQVDLPDSTSRSHDSGQAE